jgi:hypothetical protein
MKRLSTLAMVALLLFLGCTKKQDASNGRQPQGEPGRRSVAPPTDEQRKMMADCLTRKGQKLPERPNFTAEQRQTMVKCKNDNRAGGMEAFQACVKKAGIKLPEPPTAELRKAVMECRQEVFPNQVPPSAPPGAPPR